jgi:uncharacterized protein YkwD
MTDTHYSRNRRKPNKHTPKPPPIMPPVEPTPVDPGPVPDPMPEPITPPPDPRPTPPVYCIPAELVEVIDRINMERKTAMLPPLGTSIILGETAQAWAGLMADHGTVAHEIDGVGWSAGVHAMDYPSSWLGQVCAGGMQSAEELVAAWMKSDGHRAVLLGEVWREVGIGYVVTPDVWGRYHTANFGSAGNPPGSQPSEPAAGCGGVT